MFVTEVEEKFQIKAESWKLLMNREPSGEPQLLLLWKFLRNDAFKKVSEVFFSITHQNNFFYSLTLFIIIVIPEAIKVTAEGCY